MHHRLLPFAPSCASVALLLVACVGTSKNQEGAPENPQVGEAQGNTAQGDGMQGNGTPGGSALGPPSVGASVLDGKISFDAPPPRGPALPEDSKIEGLVGDPIQGAAQSLDLLQQPGPSKSLEDWAERVADPALTAPELGKRLRTAIEDIEEGALFTYAGQDINFANDQDKKDEGGITINLDGAGGPSRRTIAYEPERGRWLAQAKRPARMEELRHRGARMYCAAKEAYARQGSRNTMVMGKQSAASFKVLGLPIEIMGIEPSVGLGAPQPFAKAGNDGVQAFSIPIVVGTKMTPISLLPFLTRNQQQAVYLTTVDGEVLNDVGGFEMQTATHADAFTGTTSDGHYGFRVPLFSFAFGTVDLNAELGWGQTLCAGSDTFTGCQQSPYDRPRRVLESSFAPKRLGGNTMPAYSDGKGGLTEWGVLTDAPWEQLAPDGLPFFRTNGATISTKYGEAMWLRATQNNDKSVEVHSSMSLGAGLIAAFGASLGPFSLAAEVGGQITSHLTVIHKIREEVNGIKYELAPQAAEDEFGVTRAYPTTDLSVTPDLRADIGLNLSLKVRLGITVSGFKLNLEKTLLAVGTAANITPADPYSQGWPDLNRARFATAIAFDDGKLTTDERLVSHWPRKEIFPAQPTSVEDCLNAAAPARSLPKMCKHPSEASVSRTAIDSNLCFVVPEPQLDDFSGQCGAARLTFARGGSTKKVTFRGKESNVRILDAASANELSAVLASCLADPYLGGAAPTQSVNQDSIFMCDSSGNPYDVGEAFQMVAIGAPSEPEACE